MAIETEVVESRDGEGETNLAPSEVQEIVDSAHRVLTKASRGAVVVIESTGDNEGMCHVYGNKLNKATLLATLIKSLGVTKEELREELEG